MQSTQLAIQSSSIVIVPAFADKADAIAQISVAALVNASSAALTMNSVSAAVGSGQEPLGSADAPKINTVALVEEILEGSAATFSGTNKITMNDIRATAAAQVAQLHKSSVACNNSEIIVTASIVERASGIAN